MTDRYTQEAVWLAIVEFTFDFNEDRDLVLKPTMTIEDAGGDSLDGVMLLMQVEDEFGVIIDEDTLPHPDEGDVQGSARDNDSRDDTREPSISGLNYSLGALALATCNALREEGRLDGDIQYSEKWEAFQDSSLA